MAFVNWDIFVTNILIFRLIIFFDNIKLHVPIKLQNLLNKFVPQSKFEDYFKCGFQMEMKKTSSKYDLHILISVGRVYLIEHTSIECWWHNECIEIKLKLRSLSELEIDFNDVFRMFRTPFTSQLSSKSNITEDTNLMALKIVFSGRFHIERDQMNFKLETTWIVFRKKWNYHTPKKYTADMGRNKEYYSLTRSLIFQTK